MEQLELFPPNESVSSKSAADAFGCCSRYRACSDARACLIPDLEYSRNCVYRNSLESGTIYYGKNANTFRADIYNGFINQFKSLAQPEAAALRSVMHYFFVENWGAVSAMFLDIPEFFALEKKGFFNLAVYPDIIVDRCSFSAIKESCKSRLEEAICWAKGRCSPDEWNKRKKPTIYRDELVYWILHFDSDAVSKLCEGVHSIEIPRENYLELSEFFRDYLYIEGFTSTLKGYVEDNRFKKQK